MPARSVTGVSVKSDQAAAPATPAPAPARDLPERRTARLGLSGRLFLVTVAFVVVAEVLTYVPAVANYRIEWMSDRLAAAQVAALVLDGRTGEPVSEPLESRLLAGVNARAIAVRGGGAQRLLAIEPMPEQVADTVDLRDVTALSAIRGAWRTLVAPVHEPIRAREGAPADTLEPGAILPADGAIELAAGRPRVTLDVVNTGDRPVQIGSHYHFFEVNRALDFDRAAALGHRLDIPAGTAIRFEPGQRKTVTLVGFGGARELTGLNDLTQGTLPDDAARAAALARAKARGFKGA